MPIDFDASRWERIRENYAAWWAGELKRPLVHMTVHNRRRAPQPDLPNRNFAAQYDLSVPAGKIVERWNYELSKSVYLGDGFPSVWPNFGAGVVAAFLGARLEAREETVWFHAPEKREIGDLHFGYDADNVWLNRVRDLCSAAMERWQGQVQVGMTDLGGNLDILSSFRPGDRLLTDLCLYPDEIKRLTWEVHELWWKYYEELNAVLQPVNPGYTAWTPICSERPYYMLQCDFCYMISPDMFDEFVKPELTASCRKLTNPFYHLDGPGQLAHLDSLLTIEELKGVQWVPGDGNPDCTKWPEVYRKIRDAGKLVQIWGDLEVMDTIVSQLGSAEGVVCICGCSPEQEEMAREFVAKYAAPATVLS